MKSSLTIVTLLLSVCSLAAATLYVSPESASPTPPYATWTTAAMTIQSAIDLASDGDTVLVGAGVYRGEGNRDIDFRGKAICVQSALGPQVTILECEGKPARPHRGFYFHSAEQPSSVLSGFTIRGGYGPLAALTTDGSYSWNAGGGVYCADGASPTIRGNVIEHNAAEYGAGIMVWNGSSPVIVGNTIRSNAASLSAGGLCCFCTSGVCISNNVIAANEGCGMQLDACMQDMTVINNLILWNQRYGPGGGVNCCGSLVNLINNTIVGNEATQGAAVYSWGASLSLQNCIVWQNRSPSGGALCSEAGGGLNVKYSLVQDGAPGEGNITTAPGFLDVTAGDLRLRSDSPCINSGLNALGAAATDLDGNPRVVSGTVDLGAYEFQGAGSIISYAWLQRHNLLTDGSADFANPDGDHYNNWEEWLAGSDPGNALSSPPFITVQPQPRLAVAGSDVTFAVTAVPVESGLTYQWRFDGAHEIPGATAASLTVTNASDAHAGSYSVEVANTFGAVLSSNAWLRVDYPPLADASATRSPIVSANGVDGIVRLDGSRTSDPEEDQLEYTWWETGATSPLATGVVATAVLPVGIHPLSLVVSDGVATSTNGITVAVLTTRQAVERLLALVNRSGLPHHAPLTATLEAALASINRENPVAAARQLHAFRNKVGAQLTSSNPLLAQTFLRDAQQVIEALH